MMGTNGFRIDDDGTIIRDSSAPVIVKKNTGRIVFLVLLLLASSGTALYLYNEYSNDQAYWENRIRSSEFYLLETKDELSSSRAENETLKQYAFANSNIKMQKFPHILRLRDVREAKFVRENYRQMGSFSQSEGKPIA